MLYQKCPWADSSLSKMLGCFNMKDTFWYHLSGHRFSAFASSYILQMIIIFNLLSAKTLQVFIVHHWHAHHYKAIRTLSLSGWLVFPRVLNSMQPAAKILTLYLIWSNGLNHTKSFSFPWIQYKYFFYDFCFIVVELCFIWILSILPLHVHIL